MSRLHNIVGCEASFAPPDRRLTVFSQAHGAMAWGPRRRRSGLLSGALLGALAVLILAAAVAARLPR